MLFGREVYLFLLIAVLALLLLATGCLGTFLFLLVRDDLSPSIAMEKIRNRLSNGPPSMLPSFRDAPYRRLSAVPPRHRPTLLNLHTSEGSGQACHPDVAYIHDGFGAGRWRYWMACTPYAYGNFVHENPELFASHDGIQWAIPDGVRSPLIPRPEGQWDYNSDPDMLFLNRELWLYYRESQARPTEWETRIYLTTSRDGTNWSPRTEVLAAQGVAALLMSPAVIYQAGHFLMWTVEKAANGFQLFQRQSENGLRWDAPIPCSIFGLTGREPWHLDVIREEDRLSALVVSVTQAPDWRLHYAYSLDDGITWNVNSFLFEQAYEFEETVQYRASMLKTGCNPHRYRLWYSAANRRQMFSIAHQYMTREHSNLQPVDDFTDDSEVVALHKSQVEDLR